MRTKKIYSSEEDHPGWGAGSGTVERYEYECLCGKGKIIEEHDNIPGFRDHSVTIDCDSCSEVYEIDESKGTRGWELVPKN